MRTSRSNHVLSTVHNETQIEAVLGASYLKVKRTPREKQERTLKQKDAKRGKVVEFSKKSRKRMMNTLAKVKRDEMPCFVTLTYPAVYSDDPKDWKRNREAFFNRLDRMFPKWSGIWKLEPQERGAPHFHVLIWGVSLYELQVFVPQAWYEVVGSRDEKHLYWHLGLLGNGNKHCVQQVRSSKGVRFYASKYMSKEVSGWGNVGRWWGVAHRDRLPVGETVVYKISERLAIDLIRYMRRYAHLKSRDYRSLSIVCNSPEQWFRVMVR